MEHQGVLRGGIIFFIFILESNIFLSRQIILQNKIHYVGCIEDATVRYNENIVLSDIWKHKECVSVFIYNFIIYLFFSYMNEEFISNPPPKGYTR